MNIELTGMIRLNRKPSLRRQGLRGYTVSYPADIAESVGLEKGARFEAFYNAKGEFMIRPVRSGGVE